MLQKQKQIRTLHISDLLFSTPYLVVYKCKSGLWHNLAYQKSFNISLESHSSLPRIRSLCPFGGFCLIVRSSSKQGDSLAPQGDSGALRFRRIVPSHRLLVQTKKGESGAPFKVWTVLRFDLLSGRRFDWWVGLLWCRCVRFGRTKLGGM